MTDGFLFCTRPPDSGLSGERLTGGSRGQQDTGAPVFESHHPHEKGSYLNDRWLPFFVLGPQTRTRTAPEGLSGERLTGGSRGQQDTGAPVFESHHPH